MNIVTRWNQFYRSKYNPDISLERLLGSENKIVEKIARTPAAENYTDTFAKVSYSLIAGITLDASAGSTPQQVLISRGYATLINLITGAPYGKWRNAAYRITHTTKDSSKLKKGIVDLVTFNIFEVPIYASALAISHLVTEGAVDWGKVRDGASYLFAISPIIAPTLGYAVDACREIVNLPTAAEKAQSKQ